MEFTHQIYEIGDTIASVATPPGEGGVAIIRISGKTALHVASKIFSGPVLTYKSHTAHYGYIVNLSKEKVDDVLLMPMLGKHSYTGEDTVEIFCHGGSLITRRVLDVVLQAGARSAKPGEFTFRAYINGRLDLAQAEAVQELIMAKNERALDAAEKQLQGSLSQKVTHFQQKITLIAAILEAWVDFPDEGLEFASMEEVCQDLQTICDEIETLIRTFHNGKIIHDGLTLCLIGSPNVGKSSLMNALLDKERAIVSPIAGTTRDVLEDHLRINGLNFKLLDTAGIRESGEFIEQEGIRRSRAAMHAADLILLVLDGHKGVDEDDQILLEQVPKEKTIAIWNKLDLCQSPFPSLNFPHTTEVSAKQRLGIETLHALIDQVIWKNGPPARDEIVLTNIRHKEALEQAVKCTKEVIFGLNQNVSPEFLTLEMRQCLNALGQIIGTNISEDIISAIFSKFCIGK